MQALNAWLLGHDAGVLLLGPDPDGPGSVTNGIVVAQDPRPGTLVPRWATVRVRMRDGGEGGVREPRTPVTPPGELTADLGEA
ncbi:hypothetical protein HNP84_007852 [Thermocatellispora tengchongensis]|uniref:PASTA domain-containing protein n=1 Tax=Thermocatellispora tengchongensis TaxID=1073253 RepID=A0A840PGI8_9ACTN|nr:PASTA domain protein [Thermocatellispora tengchongensis]MBB5138099.1 hypothetical protein [Thermocatellispora tengchongensis]